MLQTYTLYLIFEPRQCSVVSAAEKLHTELDDLLEMVITGLPQSGNTGKTGKWQGIFKKSGKMMKKSGEMIKC